MNRDSHWKTGKSQFASNDVKFAVQTQDEWLTSQNEGCRLFSYFSSIFSWLILHSLFLFWKTPLACLIYLCKYEEYLNSAEFAANSYSEVPSSEIWNAVRINQHLRSWNRGGQTNEFFLNSNGIR